MNQTQYLQQIDARLTNLVGKPDFFNERAQIRSKNLLSRLSPEAIGGIGYRINEERAWTYCRYLISASIRSVEATRSVPVQAGRALKTAAEVLEHLAEFSTVYDRDELRLLSAFAYYIAGYQANAICMVRHLGSHVEQWQNAELPPLPFLYDALKAFLERDLNRVVQIGEEGRAAVSPSEEFLVVQLNRSDEYSLADALSLAGMRFILDSLILSAQYSVNGDETNFDSALEIARLARDSFVLAGDVVLANLANNLIGVLLSLHSTATWHAIRSRHEVSDKWREYLSILSSQTPSISEFWPSQMRAIEAGVIDTPGDSYVVRMPTSAGKTRIAELAIMGALEAKPGSKCVYIAPFRALSDEVQKSLGSTLGSVGYRVTTTIGSYDTDEFRTFLEGRCSVLVGTPEKVDLLFRTRPDFFEDVSLVVVDEGHIVDDATRGPRSELLLTRLKRRLQQRGTRFLCISAVMPNPEDFALWLCDSPEKVISTEWRPARQRLAKFSWRGNAGRVDYIGDTAGRLQFVPRLVSERGLIDYTPKARRQKTVIFPDRNHKGETSSELALKLCREGPVLIFCAQTPWVRSTGEALLRGLRLYSQSGVPEPDELSPVDDSESLSVALEWLGESHPLIPCLRRRIGMHYRRLPESVKQAVEDDFRRNILKILISTNTLGQGVNLPVRYVIVHSVSRWIEDEAEEAGGHTESIKVRDYWNICGRAGRAGNETEGQIFHIVNSPRDQMLLDAYAKQSEIEPTLSALVKLLQDLASNRITDQQLIRYLDSQLISMLVEEGVDEMSRDRLRSILSSSLVGIQCLRLGYDIAPLVESALRISNTVREGTVDPTLRKLFASTGLSYASCNALMERVIADLPQVVAASTLAAVGQIDVLISLGITASQGISEARAMEDFPGETAQLIVLALEWVHGAAVQALKDRHWPNELDSEETSQFIESAFSSALPWVLNAYYRFLEFQLQNEEASIPAILGYVSTMVRFGLDRIDACWARGAGAPSRQSAIAVADAFQAAHPGGNYPEFIDWFESLSEADLKTIPGLAEFQVNRILSQRA